MMGERRVDQGALFFEFSLERHLSPDHLLKAIDRFADLNGLHAHLAPFYGETGRPSIDPDLLLRMLKQNKQRSPVRANFLAPSI